VGPVPLRFSALRALRAKLRSGLLSSALHIGSLDIPLVITVERTVLIIMVTPAIIENDQV
jgi:hypothetical protein